MDITVRAFPDGMATIALIISLAVIGLGIYLLFLMIKALRVYIRKNS